MAIESNPDIHHGHHQNRSVPIPDRTVPMAEFQNKSYETVLNPVLSYQKPRTAHRTESTKPHFYRKVSAIPYMPK